MQGDKQTFELKIVVQTSHTVVYDLKDPHSAEKIVKEIRADNPGSVVHAVLKDSAGKLIQIFKDDSVSDDLDILREV